MKSLLRKLAPGVFASLAFTALAMFCMARADSKTSTSTAPAAALEQSPAVAYQAPVAAAPQQILVCGVCGAQLQQPQAVMIAAPVDGGRAAPRYVESSYYPAPVCEQPIAYAPAYYAQPLRADPFQEVRVNPIPFPSQVRAYYPAPQDRFHGHR